MSIRYQLDEHVPNALARELRRHGIDALTTFEAGVRMAPDLVILESARLAGRVVVTHDDDFFKLDAAGRPHAGIAYCPSDSRSLGEMLAALRLIHDILAPDDVAGRVEYL